MAKKETETKMVKVKIRIIGRTENNLPVLGISGSGVQVEMSEKDKAYIESTAARFAKAQKILTGHLDQL